MAETTMTKAHDDEEAQLLDLIKGLKGNVSEFELMDISNKLKAKALKKKREA
jgi:hypothetical protein